MTTMPSEKDSVEGQVAAEEKPSLKAKKQERPKRWWLTALIAGIAVLLIVFGVGIYRYEWDGGATRIVSKVVPYPAAIVDGSIIRYSDYQEDVRLLKAFYEEEKERAPAGAIIPSETDIEKRVLDRLIKDKLAEKLAKRYGVAVSSAQVRESYESTILDQTSLDKGAAERARAEARAEETLDDLYGMSSSEFRSKVLYPFLVRRGLVDAIREDDELNAEKLKKADEALQAVRGGMDFAEAALTYSEDPNVVHTEGDRGTLGRGLLPKEVEHVVFGMEVGSVSEIIRSPLGYHIMRLSDIREQAGERTHVSVEEILVKPISLDDYLEAQKKRVSIIVFVD